MQTSMFIHVEVGGDIRNIHNPIPNLTDYKKVWWQSEYRRRGWWPLTQNMEVGRMKMRLCQKEECTCKCKGSFQKRFSGFS